ncbi:MAG: hypothetical protein Q7R33_02035 [Nitrosarchaeum sp.]|nr:hypothetical protein [Nitrosarchaeum sp.]
MKLSVRVVDFNNDIAKKKISQIVNRLAVDGVKIIQSEIRKRRLYDTGNLHRSISATVRENGVTFDADAEYAGILNAGVKKHKMTYLKDAGPIPVAKKGKNFIFRVATDKGFARGKWVHPGFKRGQGFFDVSVNKIEQKCKEIIIDEGLT